jgi:hypothetical protein
MIGLINLVVSAERELRDKNVMLSDGSKVQDWLWQHKRLFFAMGAMLLGLLIVGVVGA